MRHPAPTPEGSFQKPPADPAAAAKPGE